MASTNTVSSLYHAAGVMASSEFLSSVAGAFFFFSLSSDSRACATFHIFLLPCSSSFAKHSRRKLGLALNLPNKMNAKNLQNNIQEDG